MQAVTSNATAGKVGNAGSGSPNLLLYTGFIGGTPGPSVLVIESGDGQSAAPGSVLPARLVVVLKDANGNPLGGVPLTFTVRTGGGTANPVVRNTGELGRTSTEWTLGAAAGTQTLEVSAPGSNILTFTANAGSQPPPLSITTTSLASGTVGQFYNQTLQATGGNGTYAWSIASGSLPAGLNLAAGTGAITGMPANPGTSAFTVQVASGSDIATASLSIVVNPGSSGGPTLVIESGNGQVGSPGSPLAARLVVVLTDGNGTPMGGVPVTFTVLTGGGSVNPVVRNTGELGRTSTEWTLGSATGTQTVEVSAPGSNTVTFTATTGSQPPPLVITTTSLADGTVDQAYSQALQATGGNGTYAWSVISGALPGGMTLDPSTGTISGVPGTAGTSAFTVHVVSGADVATAQLSIVVNPAASTITLLIQNGDNQTGPAGSTLPGRLVVRAVDSNGKGLGDIEVTFTVQSGGGSVTRTVATSGDAGYAWTNWTLGPATGTQTVVASAPGANSLTFTATAN
jgi:hypothetical protein